MGSEPITEKIVHSGTIGIVNYCNVLSCLVSRPLVRVFGEHRLVATDEVLPRLIGTIFTSRIKLALTFLVEGRRIK